MKIKCRDNSEEFFEYLQDLKDLVDDNCRKLEYVNLFCQKYMFILSKHLLVQGCFSGVKENSERCLSVVELFWTGK